MMEEDKQETGPIEITVPEAPVPAKRPLSYDPGIAEKILLAVADGKTLRQIAEEPGMPTKSTIQRWIMKYPDLTTAWKAAREMSASSLEEEALDMARTLKDTKDFTGTRVRAFDVAMAQFRWSASHRDPATFGQTTQPNLVVPVQIITNLDIGQEGGSKLRQTQTNTYELAAQINQDYNASHEEIEGTDYTMEPRPGVKAPEADNPSLAPERPKALALKERKPRLGRPRKGWKSPAKIKEAQTRALRKKESKNE